MSNRTVVLCVFGFLLVSLVVCLFTGRKEAADGILPILAFCVGVMLARW